MNSHGDPFYIKQNLSINREPPKKILNSSQIEMKSSNLDDTIYNDDSSDSETNEFCKTKLNFGLSSLPSKADLAVKNNIKTANKFKNYKIEVERIKQNLKKGNHRRQHPMLDISFDTNFKISEPCISPIPVMVPKKIDRVIMPFQRIE
jgi:hypothetical protein